MHFHNSFAMTQILCIKFTVLQYPKYIPVRIETLAYPLGLVATRIGISRATLTNGNEYSPTPLLTETAQ